MWCFSFQHEVKGCIGSDSDIFDNERAVCYKVWWVSWCVCFSVCVRISVHLYCMHACAYAGLLLCCLQECVWNTVCHHSSPSGWPALAEMPLSHPPCPLCYFLSFPFMFHYRLHGRRLAAGSATAPLSYCLQRALCARKRFPSTIPSEWMYNEDCSQVMGADRGGEKRGFFFFILIREKRLPEKREGGSEGKEKDEKRDNERNLSRWMFKQPLLHCDLLLSSS